MEIKNPPDLSNTILYLGTLKEKDFQLLLRKYLEDICGWAKIYQGSGEHGLDIAALIESDRDIFNRQVTVMVQAKTGQIGESKWSQIVAGQIGQLYSKKIERSQINPHNPRRILLITTGELTPEAESAVYEWNNKQPIPVEVFEGKEIAKRLIENYESVDVIKSLIESEKPVLLGQKSNHRPEKFMIGSEDAIV